jgi:hypothetical protein
MVGLGGRGRPGNLHRTIRIPLNALDEEIRLGIRQAGERQKTQKNSPNCTQPFSL